VTRPRIGVAWPREDYLSALERAGADVRRLDPDKDELPAAIEECDGVLLTGGEDVDPAEYGESERHPTVELAPVRDRYELRLARLALERDLPLFAICRGAQVLNVAAGGTLIQDIPSQHSNEIAHSITLPKNKSVHDVDVKPNTCLSALLAGQMSADGRVAVNSRHHQSVKAAAPGFVVSATAPDGVVEAIEKPNATFCVGVQWHPENFWQTGEFSPLFDGFIEAARTRQATRRG
jgi:putative glutamine amidotransferase